MKPPEAGALTRLPLRHGAPLIDRTPVFPPAGVRSPNLNRRPDRRNLSATDTDPIMGIDFSHNRPEGHHCPHWSYGGFNRFRNALAAAEGFDLDRMQGFSSGDYFGNDHTPGTRSWDEITTDLKPLLNHSDCDGELTPEECKQVYPRLREVVGELDDHYDRDAAPMLAECMLICAAQDEKLVFC